MPTPEILNVEPREAVEFFRSKGYRVSFGWQDTAALEHAGSGPPTRPGGGSASSTPRKTCPICATWPPWTTGPGPG